MSLSNILIKPIISEKSQAEVTGQGYTFLVAKGATKYQISEAVGKLFGVKVLAVRTTKFGSKTLKKAVVRLAEKDKIELFETKESKAVKEKK